MPLRIYLTGRVTIERDGHAIDQNAFPGKQGLLAFSRLAIDRTHALSRDDLATLLWPGKLPRAWDAALHSIVSKLRVLLAKAGMDKSESISTALGCYQLHLPADAWLDVEAAMDSIHEAEGLIKARKWRPAWAAAQVAYHIARRPFLAGEAGLWVDEQRERLRTVFARACECLAETYIRNGEPTVAVDVAKEVVATQPFRETAYQVLMRAHMAAGNRAEALWVYENCRKIISDELGVAPSGQTNAVYLKVLRSR
ncbi:MAG TPA: BTAD domain-containing putative transcriptional regulator [Usitatibacter sp.]|nr:BTAD domain-containing putative transcriptional regulator [Usitatibacter sp.]